MNRAALSSYNHSYISYGTVQCVSAPHVRRTVVLRGPCYQACRGAGPGRPAEPGPPKAWGWLAMVYTSPHENSPLRFTCSDSVVVPRLRAAVEDPAVDLADLLFCELGCGSPQSSGVGQRAVAVLFAGPKLACAVERLLRRVAGLDAAVLAVRLNGEDGPRYSRWLRCKPSRHRWRPSVEERSSSTDGVRNDDSAAGALGRGPIRSQALFLRIRKAR